MSSAFANTFNCSLPIPVPLGTIFILCITFCSKLCNIGDGQLASMLLYFQTRMIMFLLFYQHFLSFVRMFYTYLLIFMDSKFFYYFRYKYVVNYRSSFSKSILIVPGNFFFQCMV